MKLCHNKKCGDLHGFTEYNQGPAKHGLVHEDEIWCSITCAAYEGAFNVRTGFNMDLVNKIAEE